ncbi:MAG: hypothetical protein QF511_06530 [Rhodospirillales bacterium]|jgi:hypothetical protein|nr:hypothetical protein [Rhodospirillales bacterium]HIJ92426.1 hypothetical protein [Rhodospirillaceae bacterium]HJP54139.1 hypothetical protein [Rhodospirillales bacterium]
MHNDEPWWSRGGARWRGLKRHGRPHGGGGDPVAPLEAGRRWTVTRKREAALRLPRGDPVKAELDIAASGGCRHFPPAVAGERATRLVAVTR